MRLIRSLAEALNRYNRHTHGRNWVCLVQTGD